jgi:hypothetical protein
MLDRSGFQRQENTEALQGAQRFALHNEALAIGAIREFEQKQRR